jgi:iron-sulfur cluster assembly protein
MSTIQITDVAASKITSYLQKYPNAKGMRISVGTTGCNGYSYNFKPEMLIEATDVEICHNGISVFINEKDSFFLGDIIIDYIDDGFNSKFEINNTAEKSRCGCGESFRV